MSRAQFTGCVASGTPWLRPTIAVIGAIQPAGNGYAQPRQVVTGLGPIDVQAPRVQRPPR
ncbi:MAG: hypothetical protein WD009_05525 [Phycisphaeraceae bacterium]